MLKRSILGLHQTRQGLLQTSATHAGLLGLQAGSVTLVTGPRGCGKSSLLSLASPGLSLDPRTWIDSSIPYAVKDGLVVQPTLLSSVCKQSDGSLEAFINWIKTDENLLVTIGISIRTNTYIRQHQCFLCSFAVLYGWNCDASWIPPADQSSDVIARRSNPKINLFTGFDHAVKLPQVW